MEGEAGDGDEAEEGGDEEDAGPEVVVFGLVELEGLFEGCFAVAGWRLLGWRVGRVVLVVGGRGLLVLLGCGGLVVVGCCFAGHGDVGGVGMGLRWKWVKR